MFKKVIIGDDGLQGGRDAIALAKALADAELVLTGAYPYDSTPSRFALLGYGNALREDTKQALNQARDAGGIPSACTVAMPDTSPARALHHLVLRAVGQGQQHVDTCGQPADADVEARDGIHQRVAASAITEPHPADVAVVLPGGDEVRHGELRDRVDVELLPAFGGEHQVHQFVGHHHPAQAQRLGQALAG